MMRLTCLAAMLALALAASTASAQQFDLRIQGGYSQGDYYSYDSSNDYYGGYYGPRYNLPPAYPVQPYYPRPRHRPMPPPGWRPGPYAYEYEDKTQPEAKLHDRFNGTPPPGTYYYDQWVKPHGVKPDAELDLGGGQKAWYYGPANPNELRGNSRRQTHPPGHLW